MNVNLSYSNNQSQSRKRNSSLGGSIQIRKGLEDISNHSKPNSRRGVGKFVISKGPKINFAGHKRNLTTLDEETQEILKRN